MEDWLYYSLSIAFCLALSLLSSLRPATGTPLAVPSLPPGPTALQANGQALALNSSSAPPGPGTARSSPSTSCPPRSSSSPTERWRAASWCSAARPSPPGRRPITPPGFLPTTSTRSRPPRTARSGACSAATSPSRSSIHPASSGTPRIADAPSRDSSRASLSGCAVKGWSSSRGSCTVPCGAWP
jgi:hypothetical protein